MPENSNAQLVAWSNNRVRPLANSIYSLIYNINMYVTDYGTQGIAALINQVGASEIIQDGSDQDGRPQITGTMILNLQAAMTALQTQLETTLVGGVGTTTQAIVSPISTLNNP